MEKLGDLVQTNPGLKRCIIDVSKEIFGHHGAVAACVQIVADSIKESLIT